MTHLPQQGHIFSSFLNTSANYESIGAILTQSTTPRSVSSYIQQAHLLNYDVLNKADFPGLCFCQCLHQSTYGPPDASFSVQVSVFSSFLHHHSQISRTKAMHVPKEKHSAKNCSLTWKSRRRHRHAARRELPSRLQNHNKYPRRI